MRHGKKSEFDPVNEIEFILGLVLDEPGSNAWRSSSIEIRAKMNARPARRRAKIVLLSGTYCTRDPSPGKTGSSKLPLYQFLSILQFLLSGTIFFD
ncbi:hypothetical protein TNIN_400021 [Trichonephila inaurata madagascariensis]|uniref:Uncharacterized protein n=1 Tax=Trichonephila inaurata madagascariensis TaxID=2747483 RepID=A0A8X6Y9H9_9ARAC|nr:hypothetical protein TNIN_400021 [Trichonephila inaurata madagascariensis]